MSGREESSGIDREIIFPDMEYIYTWNYKYDYMIIGTPIIRQFADVPLWEFGFTGFYPPDYKGKAFLKLNGIPDLSDCAIIEKIEKDVK